MNQEKDEENVKHITVNGYKVTLRFGEYNPTLAATIKDMLLESLADKSAAY